MWCLKQPAAGFTFNSSHEDVLVDSNRASAGGAKVLLFSISCHLFCVTLPSHKASKQNYQTDKHSNDFVTDGIFWNFSVWNMSAIHQTWEKALPAGGILHRWELREQSTSLECLQCKMSNHPHSPSPSSFPIPLLPIRRTAFPLANCLRFN